MVERESGGERDEKGRQEGIISSRRKIQRKVK